METVTHALCWIALGGDSQTTHAIILADFKSLLQNSEVEWEAQTGMCQCSTSTFEKFDQHWKLFQGQHWENSWETRWSVYGPSRALWYHFELNWTEQTLPSNWTFLSESATQNLAQNHYLDLLIHHHYQCPYKLLESLHKTELPCVLHRDWIAMQRKWKQESVCPLIIYRASRVIGASVLENLVKLKVHVKTSLIDWLIDCFKSS